MKQPTQMPINFDKAERAKTRGMALVDTGLSNDQRDMLHKAIAAVAAERDRLTSADVIRYLGDAYYSLNNGKAMGPAMKRAATAGLIKALNELQPSGREEDHNAPCRVWESISRRVTE